MKHKKIVVIGGGITGMTTAYFLQKEIKEKSLPLEVKLIESSNRLGGVIQTIRKDGYIIEKGPDSIVVTKKSGLKLIEEIGLKDQVIYNIAGKSYIYARGRLHTMPEGSYMGIPTKVTPFAVSSLFSSLGKIRAAGDFILPKGKPQIDQSLGLFFRRRLGDEVVENLIEPLLSGIYSGDIDDLSLMALFPNFYEMEQKHRSLVLGLKHTVPKRKKPVKTEGSRKGMFISLKNGLETLIECLEKRLDQVTIQKETSIVKISKSPNGYELTLADGKIEKADVVVITTGHHQAQAMLNHYSFMDVFKKMPANSLATVSMAFPRSTIQDDIDGSGFIVSRNSDFRITACTWTHKKWPGTTPDGKALLRTYVGRTDDQEAVHLSDEEMIQIALTDLNKTMNITEKPEFAIVTRYKNMMPQYNIGHIQMIENVKKSLAEELPGVFLAGGSFEGLGIPGCIDQGINTSDKTLRFIET
jgi:protoporphyrinogen/coproporphyrinogen III oxidase